VRALSCPSKATITHTHIIHTSERLTLDTSLETLDRQPELLDQVVASFFETPQQHTLEVIIDRPRSQDN
jgi:hypothetical protein